MIQKITNIKALRNYLLGQLVDCNTKQLNEIPPGQHNNIIWNIAHMTAVIQNICYLKSGLAAVIPTKYYTPYLPGTKPEVFIESAEVDILKDLFISSLDRLQEDYSQKIFANYSAPATIQKIYGFVIKDIDDALDYLLYHEGLHAGHIGTLKLQIIKS